MEVWRWRHSSVVLNKDVCCTFSFISASLNDLMHPYAFLFKILNPPSCSRLPLPLTHPPTHVETHLIQWTPSKTIYNGGKLSYSVLDSSKVDAFEGKKPVQNVWKFCTCNFNHWRVLTQHFSMFQNRPWACFQQSKSCIGYIYIRIPISQSSHEHPYLGWWPYMALLDNFFTILVEIAIDKIHWLMAEYTYAGLALTSHHKQT